MSQWWIGSSPSLMLRWSCHITWNSNKSQQNVESLCRHRALGFDIAVFDVRIVQQSRSVWALVPKKLCRCASEGLYWLPDVSNVPADRSLQHTGGTCVLQCSKEVCNAASCSENVEERSSNFVKYWHHSFWRQEPTECKRCRRFLPCEGWRLGAKEPA